MGCSVAKAPEECCPKPQEVGQVVHGNQQTTPPTHLIWPNHRQLQTTHSLDQFQQLREEEHKQQEDDQRQHPADELESHCQVGLKQFRILCKVLTSCYQCQCFQLLHHWADGLIIPFLIHKTPPDNCPSGVCLANHAEERCQEEKEENQGEPHHVHTLVAAEEGLQGQHDASLSPTLHSSQVIHRVLGHSEGQAPIDELRSSAPEHLLKTTCRVFHLATLVEGSALHILLALALALHITDSPPLLLPHQISWRMSNHPCAICSTGTHTATAISNHAIQAEELGIVVVQIVQLVLHLVEELRALSEANIGVQFHVVVKEVRNGGVKEIRLKLMSGIANAVETWVVVPLVIVHVLRPVCVQA